MITYVVLGVLIIAIAIVIKYSFVKIPIFNVATVTAFGMTKFDLEARKKLGVIAALAEAILLFTGSIKREGWNFVFFYKVFTDLIVQDMKDEFFDCTLENVKTPDKASSKVPILFTLNPDSDNLYQFFRAGGWEGIKKQLRGMVDERTREWVFADQEGPQTWEELNRSQLEASDVLIKRIIGPDESISEIPQWAQSIPTSILLKYYSNPRPIIEANPESNSPIYEWSNENWKKVEEELDKFEAINPNARVELKKAVEERRKAISAIRAGTGNIQVLSLGVIVNRMSIGEIEVLGETAIAAQLQSKEKQEKDAEVRELKHVADLFKKYTGPEYNMTPDKAWEMIQLERGKTSKVIQEHKITFSDLSENFEKIINKFIEGRNK